MLVPPCYDDAGSVVACDPTSTNCVDTNGTPCSNSDAQNVAQGYSSLAVAVGSASAGDQSGHLSLTTPSAGSGNAGGIATGIASIFSSVTSIIAPRPTTTAPNGVVGTSGISGSGLFANPLMLALLGVLGFMVFRAVSHSR